METYIIFKYLAPGASAPNDVAITTERRLIEPDEVPTFYSEGQVIRLEADDPEEYGEQPKDYRVQYRFPVLVHLGSPGFSLSTLMVVVTDA